jgi:hypothetical protein
MAKKPAFQTIADEYFTISGKLRKSSLKWLRSQLKTHPNMDFSGLSYQVSCAYDGGNHPEYNSNCFSLIGGVYNNDGGIYLNIEDCDTYDIDSLSTEEIYFLCDYIKNVYFPFIEENK